MKKYIHILVAVITWVSVIFALAGCSGDAFRESKEEIFSNDYDLLTLVADYLVELEYERVYITSSFPDGKISVYGKTLYIDNDDVMKAITLLKESGCTVIIKADGIVSFQYWSSLDAGKGFAYSSNEMKPQLQFQTYLEELSVEDWFYYEEDFNLWKLENQMKE